jgi:hypothetical protein
MLLPSNADGNLVEMPFVSDCRKTPADLSREALAELQRSLSGCLMADLDAAGRQHLSTIRRLKGKQKYNHTAWLITSAGKR